MPEKTYTFSPFTETEVNTILSGLGELPAKISLGLIQKMHAEASSQIQTVQVIEPTPETNDNVEEVEDGEEIHS